MGDELFEPGQEPGKAPNGDPPGGDLDSKVAESVNQALQQNFQAFGEQLNQFGQQVAAAIQQAQAPAQPSPAESPPGTTVADQLLTDPEGTVSGVVKKVIADHLGPYIKTQVGDKFNDLMEQNRHRVDDEYGSGTFDELFLPELTKLFDSLPPETRSSAASVQALVRNIEGEKAKELRPKAAEVEKKRAETPTAPVMLQGGLPRPPATGQVTEEDKRFNEDWIRATGQALDLKRLAEKAAKKDPGRAWTLDDFPEFKPQAKGAQTP